MKILLTNIWLDNYAGTEVYIRDLAFELKRRGHHVEVYSPRLGKVANEIQSRGIHICDDVHQLTQIPDIIHGHQFTPTMDAMAHFRDSPAIYFVHDRTYRGDTPPQSNRVIKFIAVDIICRQKVLLHGINPQLVETMLNWVDTQKFYMKNKLETSPKTALVFSNNATPDNHYLAIKEACDKANLNLHAIGREFGNMVPNPQDVLVQYDIVFAKGKAAMESMAAGAALIVCDFRGLGGMVVPENFEYYRENNFGMNTMVHKIESNRLADEISKYSVENIKKVSSRIRAEADFQLYVDRLLKNYEKVIRKYSWKKHLINKKADDRIMRTYLQCRAAIK